MESTRTLFLLMCLSHADASRTATACGISVLNGRVAFITHDTVQSQSEASNSTKEAKDRLDLQIAHCAGIIDSPAKITRTRLEKFSTTEEQITQHRLKCFQLKDSIRSRFSSSSFRALWGQKKMNHPTSSLDDLRSHKMIPSPRARSVLCMALAIAVHFAGYELARNVTLAMFTSETLGFGNSSSVLLPFAMGCVSPFSLVVLWCYTRLLERNGPRHALRSTTLLCSAVLLGTWILLKCAQSNELIAENDAGPRMEESTPSDSIPSTVEGPNQSTYQIPSKYLLFLLFVYQSSAVQLLYTQHWGFITSVLTASEGAVWFAPIAGLGSVTSTIAAFFVTPLVGRWGLTGLLGLAGLILVGSAFFADMAYRIAEQHGFNPSKETDMNPENPQDPTVSSNDGDTHLVRKAYRLFRRVPALGMLFTEVLISQCLSSLVNFLFLLKVKEIIVNDERRAGYTGNCYAWINAVSGVLQFSALPLLVRKIGPRYLWLLMPLVMLGFTVFQAFQMSPSLHLVAMSYFAMKTIEYSLHGVATEMLYVTLDFESRFVGKEVIGLFANRFGKSGMALTLSLLTKVFGQSNSLQHSLVTSTSVVACLWLACAYKLSRLVTVTKPSEKVE